MIIRDDAHYFKGLAWLVAEAEKLEGLEIHDEIMHPDLKAELLVNYNKADRNLDIYRNTKAVNGNPELKAEYRELGWEFEEPEPPAVIPEPKPALPNWLDD